MKIDNVVGCGCMWRRVDGGRGSINTETYREKGEAMIVGPIGREHSGDLV